MITERSFNGYRLGRYFVSGKTAPVGEHELSIGRFTVDRRTPLLYLISGAQGLELMSLSIVTIALPSVGAQFGLSDIGLQWIISAYALVIGGFMLLGGRLADLFGRTRMFTGGLAVFVVSSVLCGVAPSSSVLFAGRALQGLGMAITIPATLAMVTSLYPKGPERARALTIYTIIDSLGFITGFIASGILVSVAGWRAVFLINVPIAAVLGIGVWILAENTAPGASTGLRGIDVPGAITGTGGLLLLMYALTHAQIEGWKSQSTVISVTGAAILLIAFVLIEAYVADPLVTPRLFSARSFVIANIVGIFLYLSFLGSMYFATLFLQDILEYSAFFAGLAFLPLAIGSFTMTFLAPRMLAHPRLGPRWMMVIGMGLAAISILWFSRLAPDSTYWTFVLPVFLLLGCGLSMTFVTIMVTGVAEIDERDHGAASGVLNSSFQVGAGFGPAILITVAEVGERSVTGESLEATLAGFEVALVAACVLTIVGAILAFGVPKSSGRTDNDHQTSATD